MMNTTDKDPLGTFQRLQVEQRIRRIRALAADGHSEYEIGCLLGLHPTRVVRRVLAESSDPTQEH